MAQNAIAGKLRKTKPIMQQAEEVDHLCMSDIAMWPPILVSYTRMGGGMQPHCMIDR